jgi:hypothetical protein
MVALPEVFNKMNNVLCGKIIKEFPVNTDSIYGMIGFIVGRGGLDAYSS